MKKYYLCVQLIICLTLIHSVVVAKDNMYQQGKLFINDNEVLYDTAMYDEERVYMPLRNIFEHLGGEVIWNEDTGNINIKYLDNEYVCTLEYSDTWNAIQMQNVLLIGSTYLKDYIQLHPMASRGAFEMINDRTYLYEETGKRLFEAMGCRVEIDKENHIVRIWS